ncbi:YkgJ family cysteine cluster protein [Natrinema marinum]|uniref:YkgJ family cysteine cluster protein n=1 Tax=Natrinema marinum TaxID=2961598 RepID=UPI0020C8895D|nr:YkgJ family cysteine cluster protein [Natrinema marinum]
MEVNCEGCAGCCMDWRGLLEDEAGASHGTADGDSDGVATKRHRRRRDPFGSDREAKPSREPLDDDPSFVALTRDEVRAFLEAGMGDALMPRFWHAREEGEGARSSGSSSGDAPRTGEGVDIDGHSVAAVAGRPAFFVGLRKPPKPVAPFGREEPTWLPTCVFLDPTTLQCRLHGDDLYPDECGAYPEYNLALAHETECERVERAFGGDRLLEDSYGDTDGLLLGSQAIGAKLFCHPRPADLEGLADRAVAGDLRREDRAETVAVAAASSPGTLAISEPHYERAKARLLAGETGTGNDTDESATADGGSWVGQAIRDWQRRCREAGETVPAPTVADAVEVARGAPETPGWDALE